MSEIKKVLILIPARFGSTRFPGKPLVEIKGKTLIQRVYEKCDQIKSDSILFESYVVTDNDQIAEHLDKIKARYIRVNDDVPTGSERIFLAYDRNFKKQNFDLIINVQGDEPLIDPLEVVKLAEFHLGSKFNVATMVRRMKGLKDDFFDPNRVKAVFVAATGQCLYFSRSNIPHNRDGNPDLFDWFLHIGVYSFRPESLILFNQAPVGYYENIEKLEQLRMLENSMTIGAVETHKVLIGVDTPEDIKKLEPYL